MTAYPDIPDWESLLDDDASFVLSLFGAMVKTARQDQGITQAELAKKAGVSRTYLSQIENAKAERLTLVTAYLIIRALGGNLWMEV